MLCGLFGVGAIVTSLLVPHLGTHVFDIVITIAGALFGPLLAVFSLGVFCAPLKCCRSNVGTCRRGNQSGGRLPDRHLAVVVWCLHVCANVERWLDRELFLPRSQQRATQRTRRVRRSTYTRERKLTMMQKKTQFCRATLRLHSPLA